MNEECILPKCLVLMCTYNGAQYLREQLDSILNQKNVDVEILVSDDCSTDGTQQILQEYAEKFNSIRCIFNEKNVGYAENFLHLLRATKESVYDFYALSDQDDVWLENKLNRGAEKIEIYKKSHHAPNGVLYFSNAVVVDNELHPIYTTAYVGKKGKCNKYGFLAQNSAQGCTMVFDRDFLLYFASKQTEHIPFWHDYYMALIAAFSGDYIGDDGCEILYRQHDGNQIGALQDKLTRKEKRELNRVSAEKRNVLLTALLHEYKDVISRKDYKLIHAVIHYKESKKAKWRLLFSRRIHRFRLRNIAKLILNYY